MRSKAASIGAVECLVSVVSPDFRRLSTWQIGDELLDVHSEVESEAFDDPPNDPEFLLRSDETKDFLLRHLGQTPDVFPAGSRQPVQGSDRDVVEFIPAFRQPVNGVLIRPQLDSGFPFLFFEGGNDTERGVVEAVVGQLTSPRFDDSIVVLRKLGGDEEVGDVAELGSTERTDKGNNRFVVGM
ncbi:MAG: hypothetical protein A2X20_00285 [Bacteroidetes bacterium GWE2_40_15]|nr:MAG: hypothetical protein A2X20_00285 [Bacteroidetes bacterium GWE2_40_15]